MTSLAIQHADRAHAVLGASGAKRWRNCPGSVRLSAGIVSKTSAHAEHGTAQHELAEHCLKTGTAPHSQIGKAFNGVEIDRDMADAVLVYLEHIGDVLDDGDALLIEHRVNLIGLDQDVGAEMFGTADCLIYKPDSKTLHVIDYKGGAGRAVEVEDNDQLLFYAAASCFTVPHPVVSVVVTIVQPRCQHPEGPIRSRTVSSGELLEWTEGLIEDAYRTRDPQAPLACGEWCEWCPASPTCPEQARQRMAQAKVEFQGDALTEPPAREALTDGEITAIHRAAPAIRAWLDSIEAFIHSELESGRDHTAGQFKLVAKRATRKWKNESLAAEFMRSNFRLSEDDLFDKKFRSVAQLEKLVDKADRQQLAELIVAESTGTTLAHASDKRQAVLGGAKADFSNE